MLVLVFLTRATQQYAELRGTQSLSTDALSLHADASSFVISQLMALAGLPLRV